MSAADLLASMVGRSVAGGCPDYALLPAAFVRHVEHDDTCPTYRRLKRTGVAR